MIFSYSWFLHTINQLQKNELKTKKLSEKEEGNNIKVENNYNDNYIENHIRTNFLTII